MRNLHSNQLRQRVLLLVLLISSCTSSVVTSTSTSQRPAISTTNKIQVAESGKAKGPLFVDPDNNRYFTDGTKIDGRYKAVYLTGSHTWCNLMDCGSTNPPPAFDYAAYLDFLKQHNHNFFRLWRAENARGGEAGDDFWFDPMPYQRSTTECCAFDGGNKFNLQEFNQAYFDRLRQRVMEAGDQGMYVSIMLFDGWSVRSAFPSHQPWRGHPYNVDNNINRINGDLNGDGQGDEIQTLESPQITALQEAYVRKVIDSVNDLDNVLYEISNESAPDSKQWQYHFINYVKIYEATKPKQHPVGMTITWPDGSDQDLYDSPADWISPQGYANFPPVADGKKVIITDTDHICGICGDTQWVWKSFTRGQNPIFMDPYDAVQIGRGAPQGYDPNNANDTSIRSNLGYTRDYAERMNLSSMAPRPDLCSTEFCLANPVSRGAEYLIFLPTGGTVDNIIYRLKIPKILHKLKINKELSVDLSSDSTVLVNLRNSPVQLNVEWFNPQDGTVIDAGSIQGGGIQSFSAPFSGNAVLYLHEKAP